MRQQIRLAQYGNSVRITLPPPVLRFLKWNSSSEVMIEVLSEHEFRIVELNHYMREVVDGQRAAASRPTQVTA